MRIMRSNVKPKGERMTSTGHPCSCQNCSWEENPSADEPQNDYRRRERQKFQCYRGKYGSSSVGSALAQLRARDRASVERHRQKFLMI